MAAAAEGSCSRVLADLSAFRMRGAAAVHSFPIRDYETNVVSIYRASPTDGALLLYTTSDAAAVELEDQYVYLKEEGQVGAHSQIV
jgi:hypothetical protein